MSENINSLKSTFENELSLVDLTNKEETGGDVVP